VINGWMLWVWGAALPAGVLGCLVLRRLRRTRREPAGLAAANTQLLTGLPRYGALVRRYRRLRALMGVAALLLLAGGIGLSVRPASSSRVESDKQNRDIELCLDVSHSMGSSDVAIAKSLVTLAGQLKGQRVGLTVFNIGGVVRFPLTDDSGYVRDQLEYALHALADTAGVRFAYTAGTDVDDQATDTWVGDGLMTCVQQFDRLSQRRARSIILATDNAAGEEETVTVPQAGAAAQRAGIHVYALMPMELVLDHDLAEMRAVTASTGGQVYPADAASSVAAAARQILEQEATRMKTPPVITHADRPLIPFVLALVGVAVLLLTAWEVER
jgi:Ca-activated chloride channel family protein